MVTRDQLQKYLDTYLFCNTSQDPAGIDPYMTNGLMVKGKDNISKIAFGVSSSLKLFQQAKEKNCDAIVTHHTFNFPSRNHYDAVFQKRIAYLITHKLSLFGYHFLLDAHPIVGNNVQIIRQIGAKPAVPFLFGRQPWGWEGTFEKKTTYATILGKVKPMFSPRMVAYDFGPLHVKTVVAVSGKGAPSPQSMQQLITRSVDLYITGEPHEWNREIFREAHIHFIAGGHYHTEVFGIQALMKHVQDAFPSVVSEWISLENDV